MRERVLSLLEYAAALAVVAGLVFAATTTWEPVRVAGRSMAPALNPGDLAIVHRDAVPREGSIVLVRAEGHGAVLHRVVAMASDGSATTRGDANTINDRERVRPQEIAGVVVRVVPASQVLSRWRGIREVGYHDGSTEQRKATTETTSDVVRSEQGRVQR